MKVTLIIAAAGKGERAGFEKNKLLKVFCGKTVLSLTAEKFLSTGLIDEYIITASQNDYKEISSLFPYAKVVTGGDTRTASVKNALSVATGDLIMIHDGARPFVTERIIKDNIDIAAKFGSAITAVPSSDTVCLSDGERIDKYLGKSGLFDVQTPQTFSADKIKAAYEKAGNKCYNDDGEVYKVLFGETHTVLGDKNNIKLTYAEDFERLYSFGETRFGTGFDCHKLVEGRKLILGGVKIPHDKGLLGHSDADVLTHAIMDAILSASADRDIGYHFPDNDEKYKDADSIKLLGEVKKIIAKQGYSVQSVSATVMAEKPKLLPHIPKITESLAKALGIDCKFVGISATTLEGLGFVGREEGICVHATAVITK